MIDSSWDQSELLPGLPWSGRREELYCPAGILSGECLYLLGAIRLLVGSTHLRMKSIPKGEAGWMRRRERIRTIKNNSPSHALFLQYSLRAWNLCSRSRQSQKFWMSSSSFLHWMPFSRSLKSPHSFVYLYVYSFGMFHFPGGSDRWLKRDDTIKNYPRMSYVIKLRTDWLLIK